MKNKIEYLIVIGFVLMHHLLEITKSAENFKLLLIPALKISSI
jgi:hypothetical protein